MAKSEFCSSTFVLDLVTVDMRERHMGKVNNGLKFSCSEHIQCAMEIVNYNYVYYMLGEMS